MSSQAVVLPAPSHRPTMGQRRGFTKGRENGWARCTRRELRTDDLPIMSRFAIVYAVLASAILAAQVGYVVRLVVSRLERLCVVE